MDTVRVERKNKLLTGRNSHQSQAQGVSGLLPRDLGLIETKTEKATIINQTNLFSMLGCKSISSYTAWSIEFIDISRRWVLHYQAFIENVFSSSQLLQPRIRTPRSPPSTATNHTVQQTLWPLLQVAGLLERGTHVSSSGSARLGSMGKIPATKHSPACPTSRPCSRMGPWWSMSRQGNTTSVWVAHHKGCLGSSLSGFPQLTQIAGELDVWASLVKPLPLWPDTG